jgi:hypothetical protein
MELRKQINNSRKINTFVDSHNKRYKLPSSSTMSRKIFHALLIFHSLHSLAASPSSEELSELQRSLLLGIAGKC